MKRPALALGVLLVALGGCVTSLPAGNFQARGSLSAVTERMDAAIRACWFASGENAFSDYVMESEISSLSGRPRVILVPRTTPGSLPVLVVDIRSYDRLGTVVSVYGPLTEGGPLTARINGDIARWARGSRACTGA